MELAGINHYQKLVIPLNASLIHHSLLLCQKYLAHTRLEV